jgi:dienelactone hydrolase
MSEHVKLEASDGHKLDAYVAHPEGGPIAGLVVVQEIFGVNRHIRSVADGYAKDGFLAVAPALFDRYERGRVRAQADGEEIRGDWLLLRRHDCLAGGRAPGRQHSGGLLRRTDREVC